MPDSADLAALVPPPGATAVLVTAGGEVLFGRGAGATGVAVGEVVFNTAMTGYQEVLTDPSYAAQIITFTFPHIGNVGANPEDIEATTPAARGCILRADITAPSNFRARQGLEAWLISRGLVAMVGVDTRALTRRIRDLGAPNAVLCHDPDGNFDLPALMEKARAFPGLEGLDLTDSVSCTQTHVWTQTRWELGQGYGEQDAPSRHVVAIDYGAKHNILRCLASAGCKVTVVPARTAAEDILALKPDGVFLSNGPGDPAATGRHAVPVIKRLIDHGMPLFGICLGHQMMGLALGAKTFKMALGHRGANHPVKDLTTGKVEITSMNHGFAVARDSLPAGVEETHVSLFDNVLEGLKVTDRPVFGVQYHPEASPGPQDSHYLFRRFTDLIDRAA
ncbi:glutamine-hydrolyzing carbamoyl-phosphate synthase small subunit [Roseospirillum parvum]|uniref:Carbamoyl phosphate synthase small chain n=1 Tax=Roseospirillum parvum TaxID=83401 RepID=A0A1G7TZH0_9PROT|nr:glutamine-hydrolyzing carbamoyl-phosphate synthase small subunit [Roseospirillum parvum]SDG40663.1 carbamoyl-phosphate synthase small subunit [Roseospirillum parvum]